MTEHTYLYLKRNRGWPWPELSWGLDPMFGVAGWCHACGVPQAPQSGSIVLQRKGMRAEGAWLPYWQNNAYCMAAELAEQAASRFTLDLREVEWRGVPPGRAMQVVAPATGEIWFDPDELRRNAIARHGRAGAQCAACGTWRWLPLLPELLPPPRFASGLGNVDVAASPEWFGDGWQAFRLIVFRRELAELIVAASPRDFKMGLRHG
jgi:hypothetical protein